VTARFAAVSVLALALGCGSSEAVARAPQPKVDRESIEIPAGSPQLAAILTTASTPRPAGTTKFTGRLAWDAERTVRVFSPVAGRVLRLDGELGASVPRDHALALIDSPDFGQAQSEMRQAQGNLVRAERAAVRLRDLVAHGAAASKDLEDAEADLVSARAEAARTQARLELYGAEHQPLDALFSLRTPIAGTIVERNASLGQEVRSDQMLASDPAALQPLFVVSDPSHLWVWLDVAEANLRSLKLGAPLAVRSQSDSDRVYEGRLDYVGAALDPATRTARVRGSLPNPDGSLKAEMYVTVDVIDPGAPSGVEVPSAAIIVAGEQHYVFVEQAPGSYLRRRVGVGPESDGHVAIVDGLDAGQRVVTTGNLFLEQLLDSTQRS